MRQLLTEEWIKIPKDIECKVKARKFWCKGRKGEIKNDFSHVPCELVTMKQDSKLRKGTYIRARMWYGTNKNACAVNTIASLIKNAFTGCDEVSFSTLVNLLSNFAYDCDSCPLQEWQTLRSPSLWHQSLCIPCLELNYNNAAFLLYFQVFVYKMKLVYAHFPINAKVEEAGKTVLITNFLGGAHAKKIRMQPGCTVRLSEDVKDELIFEGVDNGAVSLSCAQVGQTGFIGKKDERKFLDGIYVTDKSTKDPREE